VSLDPVTRNDAACGLINPIVFLSTRNSDSTAANAKAVYEAVTQTMQNRALMQLYCHYSSAPQPYQEYSLHAWSFAMGHVCIAALLCKLFEGFAKCHTE